LQNRIFEQDLVTRSEQHWGGRFDSINGTEIVGLICVMISGSRLQHHLTLHQQTNQIGILKARRQNEPLLDVSGQRIGIRRRRRLHCSATVATVLQRFLNLFNIDSTFQTSAASSLGMSLRPFAGRVPASVERRSLLRIHYEYGIGNNFHSSRIDRIVERIGQRWLPSYYATALGNMFRHKGRLILTQLVLITAGAMW
jgi:putative ABC transport system permease protein